MHLYLYSSIRFHDVTLKKRGNVLKLWSGVTSSKLSHRSDNPNCTMNSNKGRNSNYKWGWEVMTHRNPNPTDGLAQETQCY
jgi:hypothetical protein